MGRTLGYQEMQHMILAENVVKAYQDRANSQSWAAWAKENPSGEKLLSEALKHGTK